ncbi:cytochrome b/b6 domain-containing protein [Rheinheimera sp. UJ51]|uniref:cytochrome b/b6 domain-containing protein n=1 Tax=Rheinheimera sp. UJ51 TaxID=2892446 RepID=UPI001E45B354|nr:cytochrome b/b6 domain-containing protein [Rheinheimera sp. UJ51]MCC5452972.1 cytochrome b/b6 domain-containing protein [Rheinheimera sp. UJ51]
MLRKMQVWDLAVRVFHWSQVLLLLGLWYTGTEGLMAQHQLLAYSLAALLIGRLYWGFFGSSTARFRNFSYSPRAAWRFLRQPKPVLGHNPAGSYMIFTLLGLLTLQILSGLATFDNSYISDGPLVAHLPESWVSLASDVHKTVIDLILIAVFVHVFAAVWHSWRHDNVILSMFNGKNEVPANATPHLKSTWRFFVIVLLALLGFYLWQGRILILFL